MNKRITALTLTAALAVSAAGMTALADEPVKVLVNDEPVVFTEAEPFIENGHTLVPMRAIFEALGAVVNWDGETKTVVSYDPISDVSITLQIDQAAMFVGEEKIELETPARIVNDRTVVPVRAIAEGMNSAVDWDNDTRTVIVTKDLTPKENNNTVSQIANPWTEYKTIDELNAAIEEQGDIKYRVADSKTFGIEVKENGYRYLTSSNMAEIQSVYTVGSSAGVVIRTMPGDADISGISGGEKTEEYTLDGSLVEIYKLDDTVYAVWSFDDAGNIMSHSVAVTSSDFDTTEIVKTLVEDVRTNYPKG